jgi:transcription antitermination factor NusG
VAEFCTDQGFNQFLPLHASVRNYPGKKVVFLKPLFSGYVFVQIRPEQAMEVRQCRHVARLLEPGDQAEFAAQLEDIRIALQSEREVRLAPNITEGRRVQIRSGPMRGLEGRVLRRKGITEVVLRLDFIGQAAAVQVEAQELELI